MKNSLRCDYCGYLYELGQALRKAGDECPKCKRGILCAKGTRGNP